MMKAKYAFFFFLASFAAQSAYADLCTATIRDRAGYEYDRFTKSSYSIQSACSDAIFECSLVLSEYNSYGYHYGSECVISSVSDTNTPPSYPPPHPPSSPSYPYPSYPNYPSYPSYPNYPSYPSYPDRPRDPHYPREPRYPDRPREPRPPHYPDRPRDPNPPRDPKPPRPPRWPR